MFWHNEVLITRTFFLQLLVLVEVTFMQLFFCPWKHHFWQNSGLSALRLSGYQQVPESLDLYNQKQGFLNFSPTFNCTYGHSKIGFEMVHRLLQLILIWLSAPLAFNRQQQRKPDKPNDHLCACFTCSTSWSHHRKTRFGSSCPSRRLRRGQPSTAWPRMIGN